MPTRKSSTLKAAARPTGAKRLALPRVPLPRQTEQTHEDKTRRPSRKAKYKRPPSDEET